MAPVYIGFAAPTSAVYRTGWGLGTCATHTRCVPAGTCSATLSWLAFARPSKMSWDIRPSPPRPVSTALAMPRQPGPSM